MLKKAKQKQYKSKRDFKDDLELIWSNCKTYNAQPVGSLFSVYVSTSHLSLVGSPTPGLRWAAEGQGREAAEEYYGLEGACGPNYPGHFSRPCRTAAERRGT